MSIQELNTKIKTCNFLQQAGINNANDLLNMREEDLEMIHEISKRLRGDISYRLWMKQ